jgi:hypothetical protein
VLFLPCICLALVVDDAGAILMPRILARVIVTQPVVACLPMQGPPVRSIEAWHVWVEWRPPATQRPPAHDYNRRAARFAAKGPAGTRRMAPMPAMEDRRDVIERSLYRGGDDAVRLESWPAPCSAGSFIGLYQVLLVLGLSGWQPVLLGSVAAAMTTAAFYSAMPVALVGATAGVLASIGYLIVAGNRVELPVITATAAGAGSSPAPSFSWMVRRNARPLAETLTGLLAGLGAGVILSVVLFFPQPMGPLVMAAGVVALVGALFQLNEHWIVQACHGWLPDGLAAPLVAALIAGVVGASVWIMGGTTAGAWTLRPRARSIAC